ncbi:MAG: FAD-binding oxidoreductase [Actinomycetota bacterium]
MATVELRTATPATAQEAAEVMRALGEEGTPLRPRGGGTKFSWGARLDPGAVVSTRALNRVTEHNAPDMTAVLQAGTPLAAAQARFATSGQMLALDPPLVDDAATVGGIIAANDSGPLRHRYRAARDLVLGMTVVLSDGTLARSGSRVIKNVAGYDVAKLFTGSLGTLGLIVEVIVRLHPRPPRTVTVVGTGDDSGALQKGSQKVGHAPLEVEALDLAWDDSSGRVLARFGGVAPEGQATVARKLLQEAGLDVTVTEDDAALWATQRARQRAAADELSVKVSTLPVHLGRVIDATRRLGGTLVGRAGLGLMWVRLAASESIEGLRSELEGAAGHCVLLDAPAGVRAGAEVWGEQDPGRLALMRSVKSRFDPAGVCAPGIHVGGI